MLNGEMTVISHVESKNNKYTKQKQGHRKTNFYGYQRGEGSRGDKLGI